MQEGSVGESERLDGWAKANWNKFNTAKCWFPFLCRNNPMQHYMLGEKNLGVLVDSS